MSGHTDLYELTYALVLRNFLRKVQRCSTRIDLVLKVIVPYMILLGGVYGTFYQVGTFREIPMHLWNSVTSPFSSKITVPANHALNAAVLAWFASHGVARDRQELGLAENLSTWDACKENEDMNSGVSEADTTSCSTESAPAQPLSFIPDFGKHHFRYKGHFMSMERKTDGAVDGRGRPIVCLDPNLPQNVTLECFPTLRGTAPLREFLDEVRRESTPVTVAETKTTVYRPRDGSRDFDHRRRYDQEYEASSWIEAIMRPSRSIDSVALETSKKQALVDDIAYYLTPECECFYANRGYPYRRGFLLYGPPGTGKTSFCLALAGHFSLDLYILSLGDKGMTDQRLDALFGDLPKRCILLLEDVDSAGLEREVSRAELRKLRRGREDEWEDRSSSQSSLTLSGLLNNIDGPLSKDGRVVCMTSNAPDNLDPALIRPGRCDQKVLFGYANEEICIKLFEDLYTKTPDELVEGETNASTQHNVAQLARTFASAIPSGGKISPAEVQGYLMIHRRDPLAAVAGARTFAKDIIEVKAREKNVAEHANEIEKNGNSAAEFGSENLPDRNTEDIESLEDFNEGESDEFLTNDVQVDHSVEEEDDDDIRG